MYVLLHTLVAGELFPMKNALASTVDTLQLYEYMV